MPRAKSENTVAVNLKIPPEWIEMADKLASASEPPHTRTAILRVALGQGLEAMMRQRSKRRRKTKK